jgi:hypothetical protein
MAHLYIDERGLVISLSAKYFFDSGKAVLRPEVLPIIDQIASIPTTSFESALGLSPLFVREIRPMMTRLNLADPLQHVSNRLLAYREDHFQ